MVNQGPRRLVHSSYSACCSSGNAPGSGDFEDDYDGESELTAAEALLEYGALRMADGAVTTRGKLRPAGRHDRYLEQLPEPFRPHIHTFAEILAQAMFGQVSYKDDGLELVELH